MNLLLRGAPLYDVRYLPFPMVVLSEVMLYYYTRVGVGTRTKRFRSHIIQCPFADKHNRFSSCNNVTLNDIKLLCSVRAVKAGFDFFCLGVGEGERGRNSATQLI